MRLHPKLREMFTKTLKEANKDIKDETVVVGKLATPVDMGKLFDMGIYNREHFGSLWAEGIENED